MTNTAWLDCTVGVAGDMLLGALIDAGAAIPPIQRAIADLGLTDWTLQSTPVLRNGLRALKVTPHSPSAPTSHPHRPWSEVSSLLQGSTLPAQVKENALRVYQRLAEVEARLHQQDVDAVELHEVGANDAIIDIVGVCMALHQLDITEILASPLPMATGSIQCSHGQLPLPSPATLELIKGWPVSGCEIPGEWVTPTGAALVTTLAKPGGFPDMTVAHIGCGAGTRNTEHAPNMTRVVIGVRASTAVQPSMEIVECTLDDMSGELIASAVEKALAAGAVDAWTVAVMMKKGRPGVLIQTLVPLELAPTITDLLLRHSSSIGVRHYTTKRTTLDRQLVPVDTQWGVCRVKFATKDGQFYNVAPEFADAERLAASHNLPVKEVYRGVLSCWNALHSDSLGGPGKAN